MTMAAAEHGTAPRRLIVNADDFGQSAGVNEGIIHCYEAGIVTSASLMVRWPSASAAAGYARANPALSVGLHVDLGEWAFSNGEWVTVYEVVPPQDSTAARTEIASQLDTFRRLVGCDPTHLDSHQHVHRDEPARSIVARIGEQLGIPCRHFTDGIRYCGDFYGQSSDGQTVQGAISVEHLIAILTTLPHGVTELCCHPGLRNDAPGMYVADRAHEAAVLCDPDVRAAIEAERINLLSFSDLAQAAIPRSAT